MMDRALQEKLNLPLPDSSTPDERAEALTLLRSAIERLRIDRADTAGLDQLQTFAAGCHRRHREAAQ